MPAHPITSEDLENIKRFVSCDFDTGVLKWIKRSGPRSNPGTVVRAVPHSGHKYGNIQILGRMYKIHRLIYAMKHGPLIDTELEIDHINGDTLDNRISNLRRGTKSQNLQNMPLISNRGRYSKYTGVSYLPKKKRGCSNIRVNGKQISIGTYKTEQEAQEKYAEAKAKLHDFYVGR